MSTDFPQAVHRGISRESDNGCYVNYDPEERAWRAAVDRRRRVLCWPLVPHGRRQRRAAPRAAHRARALFAGAELCEDRFEGVDDLVAVDPRLRKTELQIELLGGRSKREHIVLR